MNSDWQTWAALGVVIVTAVILLWRGVFRKKAGCSSGCGCEGTKLKSRPGRGVESGRRG